MTGELSLFVLWERAVGEVLDHTARFPKAVRFTFASRIDSAALDILEQLVEARYAAASRKQGLVQQVDGALARLRVLLRLSHTRGYLSHGGYEQLARTLDEVGRMVGGWRKQLEPQ